MKQDTAFIGQRVKYTPSRIPWIKEPRMFVSITNKMYFCLDRTPYITGTVVETKESMGILVRPDGWPVPEVTLLRGFWANEENVEPLKSPQEIPGVLTTPTGRPLEIQEILDEVNAASNYAGG